MINRVGLKPLAGFSVWAFVAAVSGVIWAQMDKVILAAAAPVSVLTGYDIANRLQSAASYPLSFTTQAVVPAAANLSAMELTGAPARTVDSRHTLYAGIVVPCHNRGDDPGPPADRRVGRQTICGHERANAALPLYQLVISSATIAHTIPIGLGRMRTIALYSTSAMVIDLVISVALVRPLGISGVIIGTLVGVRHHSPAPYCLGPGPSVNGGP